MNISVMVLMLVGFTGSGDAMFGGGRQVVERYEWRELTTVNSSNACHAMVKSLTPKAYKCINRMTGEQV